MKYKLLIILILLLFLSGCTTRNQSGIKISVKEVSTNQYPEGSDFEGSIYYDIDIQNRSDSLLAMKGLSVLQLNDLDKIEHYMYGVYKGDTIPLLYYGGYGMEGGVTIVPWSFVVGRSRLVVEPLYEKKYKTQYSTFRDFSKDVVANTVLYFITNDKTTIIVKNDKVLKFEGRPNEQAEYILLYPLQKGEIPHKKKN